MILRTLESRRMTLVSATVALLEADLSGRAQLAELIGAGVPQSWPPDLYERAAMKFALVLLQEPAEQRWSFWYLLTQSPPEAEILGICGFKGRPDQAGSVEIGYSVLSQYRNQGYASEAVSRLVLWAFSHQNVKQVTAETLPHLRQSIRVLEKNGFIHTGPGSEHGVVRYAVQRPDRR
ncbi:MAG: GNAT family N-acetyltransferase [Proteobacteria bacterium]|nr:GNAT family N-acetyltransferase [Pseudomonadota bacterium]